MKIPRPGTPVCIVWQDAQFADSWFYGSDTPDFESVDHVTYGVIKGVDKNTVVVCQTIAAEAGKVIGWLGHMAIPRGCIRRVDKIA